MVTVISITLERIDLDRKGGGQGDGWEKETTRTSAAGGTERVATAAIYRCASDVDSRAVVGLPHNVLERTTPRYRSRTVWTKAPSIVGSEAIGEKYPRSCVRDSDQISVSAHQ